MKKSCSGKESKVITTKDADNLSNADSTEHLTEEQLSINKQLSDSGIDCEGLGWLEKRNIVKTINVSLDSAGSERLQRLSPRSGNSINTRARWVENSFENCNKDNCNNEKNPKTRSGKKDQKFTSTAGRKGNLPTCKKTPEVEDIKADKKENNARITSESPKSSKRVHYIKIQLEEDIEESPEGQKREADTRGVNIGKKRASHSETSTVDTPKKLKMEEVNNGVSPTGEENSLSVEVELENRKRNTPFVLRDIKVIVSECDVRNMKWKETFSKYKCPARWGIPIVRNCNEKWDGKQIPQKLLHRFQKYLTVNNLFHPVFLPVDSQTNVNLNKLSGEVSLQLSTCMNSQCGDEVDNDFKVLAGGSAVHDESKESAVENNLNASTSASDSSGRMVLRNRNQQKPIVVDEDDFSSDDSDEWCSKQKPNKKQKINSTVKKVGDQNNKQLVAKLERCNINKRNGNEGNRKNGNKNEVSFTGGSLLLNSPVGNSKTGPDPDTMVCPICSIRFEKQLIESHATECASKTYKD